MTKQVNNEMMNELVLYMNNTRNTYENIQLVCKNLARKQKKRYLWWTKVVKAFYNLVNYAQQQYYRKIFFGGVSAWYLLSNIATRQAVAKELLEDYQEDREKSSFLLYF